MAATIVDTLFGVSPERFQQERDAAANARALAFAQLDPFQQANFAIGRGANMLAGAVGGALGGQDPELQRVTQRQQIASQIDLTNPDSIQQGMGLLRQAGDTLGMQQLAEIYRQQLESGALIAQRNAAANRESKQSVPPDIQLAREMSSLQEEIMLLQNQPASPQRDYSLRLASGQLSQLERLTAKADAKPVAPNIKEIGVTEGSRKPVYLDVNTDQQFVFDVDENGKQVRKLFTGGVDRTTAKVNATATTEQQGDFAKVLNKEQGKVYSNAIDLRNAAITASKTYETLGKLDDQGLISGSFASGRLGATNFLATIGLVTQANSATLAKSENFKKIAGDAILAAIGGKLGAQISDADRKFIESLVPQLENSAAARRQLIDYMKNKYSEIISSSTELIDYAETKKTLSGYKPKVPLSTSRTGTYSNLSDEELDKQIAAAQKKK